MITRPRAGRPSDEPATAADALEARSVLTDRLDTLVSVYLAGRGTPGGPSPEELCRDCPELLSELKRRISAADFADALLKSTGGGGGESTGEYAAAFPEQLGAYRVRGVLGRGGMGAVLLADDPALGRQVAVKVMLAHKAADPAARERFLREARAAAAVRHDHVVPIFHVGEHDGTPFLVMPLLEGESLEARLKRGPLPPDEVARVGREAALGLAAAHAKGLIHRDVKPANLWLEAPNGRVLVLDFGLARSADAADGVTRAGGVLGTAAYMAPEQADGLPVDARADLFALGATLYECATGVCPFARPTLTAMLKAVAAHQPPPPHEVNPAVSVELSALIMRLLAKRPADRPASAAVLAAVLAGAAAGVSGTAVTADMVPAGGGRRRSRGLALWAGLVVVSVAAVGAWFGTRPPSTPERAAQTNPEMPRPDRTPVTSPPTPGKPAPAAVTRFEVRPLRHLGDNRYERKLLLGLDGNASAAVDEAVEVAVTLSRPTYCYLAVFRADGVDEVLYPQDPDDVPARTDRPAYPSKRRDAVYELNDGPGLWAVALVTSDDPLPGYRAWRAKHPGGPWKPRPTPPAAVMLDDGLFLETFVPGQAATRSSRGEKVAADRTPVVELVDWLKAQTGSPAAALAFPVVPAK